MTAIKDLVDQIDEELDGAKKYAEAYVQAKVDDDSYWKARYHEMAEDELKHADYIHELTAKKIKALGEVLVPPQAMLDKWESSHKDYVERAAWIRQMLSM